MTNIPVFLASDNNYAPFVASTIASICDNTKSFIDFYILDGGITKQNQERITKLKDKFDNFSLEFLEIDMEKEFSSIDYKNALKHISLSTYNRFLIPQLKPKINRALYSDVDVIALNDIAEMYHEDLNGKSLGAIAEAYLEGSVNIERKERLNLSSEHTYFSAGNLLIDCKAWRTNNIAQKLFAVEKEHRVNLKQADMDVLNIYYNNNYQLLNPKYCVLDTYYDFYKNIQPVIRHFHGEIKPWHISPNKQVESLMPNHKEFWHYLEITDFYNEILEKTQNETEQNNLLRRLRLLQIVRKKITK